MGRKDRRKALPAWSQQSNRLRNRVDSAIAMDDPKQRVSALRAVIGDRLHMVVKEAMTTAGVTGMSFEWSAAACERIIAALPPYRRWEHYILTRGDSASVARPVALCVRV